MTTTELQQRAEHHAKEAERLLAGRMGIITNYVKAGVHATMAVYYAGQADRVAGPPSDDAAAAASAPRTV